MKKYLTLEALDYFFVMQSHRVGEKRTPHPSNCYNFHLHILFPNMSFKLISVSQCYHGKQLYGYIAL